MSNETQPVLVEVNATTRGAADSNNERQFRTAVVGQDAAVQWALDAIARARNPLRDKSRPIAIGYFLGYSRTGKTLIAEMIAEILHGDRKRMIKVNGGAYKKDHQVAQLVGAPPGYLGHKESDKIQKGVIDKSAKLGAENLIACRGDSQVPVTVILVDEANLMHPDSDDIWMSINDKGQLDLGNNDVVDFTNCIIIFTSNIGMDAVKEANKPKIGFFHGQKSQEEKNVELETIVMGAIDGRYRPEWKNRIDDFLVFAQHTSDQLDSIVQTELTMFRARMEHQLIAERVFTLTVEESARSFLLQSSLKDGGNIANLKRMMQKHLIDPIGNLLSQGYLGKGDELVVRHNEGADRLSFLMSEEVAKKSYGKPEGTGTTSAGGSTESAAVSSNNGPVRQMWMRWHRGGDINWMRLMQDDNDGSMHYLIRRGIECTCSCGCKSDLTWEWMVPYEKGVDPVDRVGTVQLSWFCKGCKSSRVSDGYRIANSEWRRYKDPE